MPNLCSEEEQDKDDNEKKMMAIMTKNSSLVVAAEFNHQFCFSIFDVGVRSYSTVNIYPKVKDTYFENVFLQCLH